MRALNNAVTRGIGLAFIAAGSAYFGGLGAFAVDAAIGQQDFLLAGIPAGSTFFTTLMMRFGGSPPASGSRQPNSP